MAALGTKSSTHEPLGKVPEVNQDVDASGIPQHELVPAQAFLLSKCHCVNLYFSLLLADEQPGSLSYLGTTGPRSYSELSLAGASAFSRLGRVAEDFVTYGYNPPS